MYNCINCNKKLTGLQKKYCSKRCKNLWYQKKIRKEFKEKTGVSLQSKKGIKIKLLIINELGGCCSKCGYKKNISALEFHHVNSYDKKFNVDLRTFSNHNIDIIRKELKKCVLVCSNCHQEIHNPHLDMENVVNLN